MAHVSNDLIIYGDEEIGIDVWWDGLEWYGLHFCGPTAPSIGMKVAWGYTGFTRWYEIKDGHGVTFYSFTMHGEGGPLDYTIFQVVGGGLV
jgi:hypothetical protein